MVMHLNNIVSWEFYMGLWEASILAVQTLALIDILNNELDGYANIIAFVLSCLAQVLIKIISFIISLIFTSAIDLPL